METTVPSVAAVYQVIVPPDAVAVKVCVVFPLVHTDWSPPETGGFGLGDTVIVASLVAILLPLHNPEFENTALYLVVCVIFVAV